MMESMVYVKVWKFEDRGEVMVALCDPPLLGKTFREGRLKLEVKQEFYEGELMSVDEAVEVIKKATVVNFVGDLAIECGLKAGLLHEESIIRISGVPHAQFILML